MGGPAQRQNAARGREPAICKESRGASTADVDIAVRTPRESGQPLACDRGDPTLTLQSAKAECVCPPADGGISPDAAPSLTTNT